MAAPYEPQPYRQDPDETVQCPGCGKMNDTDASYCDQCGLYLVGRTDIVVGSDSDKEAAFRGMMGGQGQ